MNPAVSLAHEEPRLLEHPHVFGDGGQRDVERRGELADRRLALREPGQDRAAGRVRERGEGRVEGR